MEDLSGPLYHSIADGDIEALQRLIDNGANVNQIYEDLANISTKSILHIACEKGRLDCVKILLEHGAMVNVRDNWGMTPIRYCISTDYDEIAEILIKKDRDAADSQDKYGKSVLHAALDEGSEKFVKLFLQSGADVNITTDFGITPLMTLMSSKDISNYFEPMGLLIDFGADINLKDYRDRRTALHMAVVTLKVDAVELLLSLGADPNVLDKGRMTPLTTLLSYHIPLYKQTELKDEVLTIAIMLTQAGSDMNTTKTDLCNPLIMAAHVKCTQLVRFFLDSGADVDTTLPYSSVTALLVAVKQKDISTIRALIDWNCRLDIVGRCHVRREDYEFNPFELAVDQELWDIVELFITAGYNTSKHSYLRSDGDSISIPNSLKRNTKMLNFLRLTAACPQTLMNLCALAIYKAINSNISAKLDILPLPTSIKEYLKI